MYTFQEIWSICNDQAFSCMNDVGPICSSLSLLDLPDLFSLKETMEYKLKTGWYHIGSMALTFDDINSVIEALKVLIEAKLLAYPNFNDKISKEKEPSTDIDYKDQYTKMHNLVNILVDYISLKNQSYRQINKKYMMNI